MNILIVEDEPYAAKQLKQIVSACRPGVCFVPEIDNVEDAVHYLRSGQAIDLIFMDIHLADGQAFEIFESVQTFVPIIFTTAYDQYAIRAFKVNSVDYLLKPVSKENVEAALAKFERQYQSNHPIPGIDYIKLLHSLISNNKVYKENFLVPFKDKLLPVSVKEFAWFEIKNGVVIGTKFDKTNLVLEERSLEELAQIINPQQFYRANRQYLINRMAVKEVAQYFNGKLLAVLLPSPPQSIVISREKTYQFKEWMKG
ncbi:response regulator transcription factor [Niastella caeni]|uniref:Response regulator transcription factor n=1 Tax=Niastella caeni TaxID=2569763 RepID=A0A4S8HYF1_9BACT|nr:LytTR family DNA-binding domain-containing protein [Niastella caeni]THU39849.1 response regulator transcription factor [Niastella caeni]